MEQTSKQLQKRQPQVDTVREFLEIARDFTDPKEAIREAISNSLDWGASQIKITVQEDKKRPDEELVITIWDNGAGLNEDRLHAFFDLGRTIPANNPDKIGYKGHGTKTYFNSREVEVFSNSKDCTVYAVMKNPLQELMANKLPEYEYDVEPKQNDETFTQITLRGYNMNKNRSDFGHKVLRDYILWFTKFGSVEKEFGVLNNKDKVLYLQGLGAQTAEQISFGHVFPPENEDINKLRKSRPGDWPKIFVKRWLFSNVPVHRNPGKSIDMVFYIEGDEAKRAYNPMLRGHGKVFEYGMYKVEERYGLWVCKDYIPIKRYNEWLGLGKRLETKYHAFVNCQDFRLTANRADIGNTPPDLLKDIEDTVRTLFEQRIIGSRDYQEYEEAVELEEQYQTANQEKEDFDRRRKRAQSKKVCQYKGIELVEPGVEMGLIALFNQIYAIEPSIFPFRIVDYDTKRGYDALATHSLPLSMSSPAMAFIEFKYVLSSTFNHSFDHLLWVVCWDCNIQDGQDVADIAGRSRKLTITAPDPNNPQKNYTRYMLVSATAQHNIEVFVLKQYLKEKLGIEFQPRIKQSAKRGTNQP